LPICQCEMNGYHITACTCATVVAARIAAF
jgi:hypothetical protein